MIIEHLLDERASAETLKLLPVSRKSILGSANGGAQSQSQQLRKFIVAVLLED